MVESYLTSEVSYQESALSQGINNDALVAKWVNDFRIAGSEAMRHKKKDRTKSLEVKKEMCATEKNIEVMSLDTSAEHIK